MLAELVIIASGAAAAKAPGQEREAAEAAKLAVAAAPGEALRAAALPRPA